MNRTTLTTLLLSLSLAACSPPVNSMDVADTGAPGADAQSEAAVSMPDATAGNDASATEDGASTPDAAAGPAGSCGQMVGALSYCIDFLGTDVTAEVARMTCTTLMGTYSATNCATANRVGRCTLEGGTAAFSQVASYYSPTTVQEATMACTTAGGMFVAD